MAATPPSGLKILMLHGFTQSGRLFSAKTKAFEKALIKAFPSSTLHYPTGPIGLSPSDIPGYTPSQHETPEGDIESFAWWRRKEGATVYEGIEKGLARIAETIEKEGPFDGVIGFSQGGCATGFVTSLLDAGRKEAFDAALAKDPQKLAYPESFLNFDGEIIQPPLKFAVVYSGFAAPFEHYGAFYEPKIKTPALHYIGTLDTVVDESRSKFLAECFEGGEEKLVFHPGGHFLPSQKVWLDTTIGFIRSCVDGKGPDAKMEEPRVEDMDVPF